MQTKSMSWFRRVDSTPIVPIEGADSESDGDISITRSCATKLWASQVEDIMLERIGVLASLAPNFSNARTGQH